MKIAVITGASSGIGKEFVKEIAKRPDLDEIWVIARRKERLEALKTEVSGKIRPIPLDLTDKKSIEEYEKMLGAENPEVAVLVNAGGFGRFGAFCDLSLSDQYEMIDLNEKALMGMTYVTIPFMKNGSEIFEICSLSAFQPVPYIGVYSATKAFVMSFSRALSVELKKKGIKVTAVCPFWVKTEFFNRAVTDNTVSYYALFLTPEQVVKRAIRDMKKGKDVSVADFRCRAQRLLVKLLPQKAVMKIWCKQQKL